ncbi:hypothetical protein [Clostridium sp.]|uniref:hypothetical protein n=1 Tax=Clostridium sp. TaxID=1506 RepID=UPI0032163142
MKRSMITVVSWSLIISTISMVCFFNIIERKENEPFVEATVNNNLLINNRIIEHMGLAEEALKEFGATSSEEAANLWAKGIMTRNGVLQYSVMNKELQKEFKKHLSNANITSWVTGTSSPWITSYEMIDEIDVSSKVKLYKIKFNLATEEGQEKPAYNTLTIMYNDNKWAISSIR